MKKTAIQARVLELLEEVTGGTACTPEQDLMDELGLSSIEMMDLFVAVEQEFRVKIPSRQTQFVSTAADLVELICDKAGIS